MSKLTRFLVAAVMISAFAVVAATRAQLAHSYSLSLLLLLLAALVAAGILAFRSRGAERRSGGKNLSPTLATLSSAAILAVYAAGYHRTAASGGGFTEESNRRDSPPVIAARAIPEASLHQIEPHSQDPGAPAFAMPSAARQHQSRPAKSTMHSAMDATSSAPPSQYATAAPLAPQTPLSRNTPTQDSAAPQIAMPAPDPSVQPPVSATPAPPQPKAVALLKDGTYFGWGSCRHGDIQASVTVQDGKIASTAITQCLTRYSCSWISDLPGQVVKRQSPEVDYVSGATQSTDAFYGAVVSALSKARN